MNCETILAGTHLRGFWVRYVRGSKRAPCNTGRHRSQRSHEVRHHLCVRTRTRATLWIGRRDAMIFDPNFDSEKRSCPLSPYGRSRRVLNEPGLSQESAGS